MHCINTSRRLGVSQLRCSAFETTTLHATQPSPPLGAPSSPHTSSERDGGKRILSQNNWQLRGRGNKDEPRFRSSRSTHPWLLLVKTWHTSHLTATIDPKHFSWQPRYQMMKLWTIYFFSYPLSQKNSLLTSLHQAVVWLVHILQPRFEADWWPIRRYVINTVRKFINQFLRSTSTKLES